jgi:hypothetical protein
VSISSNEDTAEFANKLTSKESEIYFGGVSAAREIENWKKKKTSLLKKSAALQRRLELTQDNNKRK